MPEQSPDIVTNLQTPDTKVLVSVQSQVGDKMRDFQIQESGGNFRLVIKGLDLRNFADVVGHEAAMQHRSFVCARRGRYDSEVEAWRKERDIRLRKERSLVMKAKDFFAEIIFKAS
jgi:hypothetical protein